MKKILHKTCLRTEGKLKIERIKKLVQRVENMYNVGENTDPNKILDETLKFLGQVPDILALITKMEYEYKFCYSLSETATNALQKKGRSIRRETRNYQ